MRENRNPSPEWRWVFLFKAGKLDSMAFGLFRSFWVTKGSKEPGFTCMFCRKWFQNKRREDERMVEAVDGFFPAHYYFVDVCIYYAYNCSRS